MRTTRVPCARAGTSWRHFVLSRTGRGHFSVALVAFFGIGPEIASHSDGQPNEMREGLRLAGTYGPASRSQLDRAVQGRSRTGARDAGREPRSRCRPPPALQL